MNRIDNLFKNKNRNILSVYFTAGFPELNDTTEIIAGLENAGADIIEIGFPFSDPVADGPVIQASSHRALENGMNLDILFGQLVAIRETCKIPRILMGYFNTVFQYGVENFLFRCKESNISGVIIPDLPPEIYEAEYRSMFESAGIYYICLISPQTPPERISYLNTISKGFIYRLSMSATTGTHLQERIKNITDRNQNNTQPTGSGIPVLIGFGIHDNATFLMACEQASGAIIGTEFIKRLSSNGSKTGIGEICKQFVSEIRGVN